MKKYYYTIGEVSNLLNVKPHVIRYWESEFTWIKPKKNSGRIRKYSEKQVLLLRKIYDLLYNQRYTIEGARQKIKQERTTIQEIAKDALDESSTSINEVSGMKPEIKEVLLDLKNDLTQIQQTCKKYTQDKK